MLVLNLTMLCVSYCMLKYAAVSENGTLSQR